MPVWPTGWCQIDCEWSYLGDKRCADIKGSNRRPPSGPREREVAERQYTILTPVSAMEPPTLPPSGSPSSQEDAIAGDPSHESDVVTSEVELRRPLGGALPVSEAGVELVSHQQSHPPPPTRYSGIPCELQPTTTTTTQPPKRYSGVRSGISRDVGEVERPKSPSLSRPSSPALSLVEQVGQWPFGDEQARVAAGTIRLSPPVPRRPSLDQDPTVETPPASPPRLPRYGDDHQSPVAREGMRPQREAAPDRGGCGATEHQQGDTPVSRSVRDKLGSPSKPFHPSLVRGGDVPGYTEDRQGFTALLRIGDRAQDQGRPMAAAVGQRATSRYREEDQPARKKLEFAPESTYHPKDSVQEKENDELRQGMLELLLAQREASARQEAQMKEFAAHQAAQMQDFVTECQGQMDRVENQSLHREDLLRQEVAETMARSVETMRDGLARLTQALPDMMRELVPESTEPEPVSASTPRDATGGAPRYVSAGPEWSQRATVGSGGETSDQAPACQPESDSHRRQSLGQSPDHPDRDQRTPGRSPGGQDSQRLGRSPSSPVDQTGHVKVNKNQVKLPEFAGKPGESLQSFLNKVENGARLGAWTPEYRAGQLYAQITGGALQYVDSLPAAERETYESLRAALQRRYEGELEREKSKEALRAVRRGRNETIEDLGRRITELTRKAYPPERREEEGVYAFRNAVADKMADQIVVQGYQTVDQCVVALSKLECHQEHRNRHRQARIGLEDQTKEAPARAGAVGGTTPGAKRTNQSTPAVRAVSQPAQPPLAATKEALKELFGPVLEDLRKTARNLGRSSQQNRTGRNEMTGGPRGGPSKDRPCMECGSAEHWANDCPRKRKSRQGNGKGLALRSKDQPQA